MVLPPSSQAGDAGPAAPRGRPRSPSARRRKAWLPVVAGVAALALVAAILFFVNRHSGNPGGSAVAGSGRGADGASHSQGKVAGNWAMITVPGVFPQATETVNGLRFTQVASGLDQNCALAANGAFAEALTSQGCKRVVRATFVDSGKQYAVTVGVAALPSTTAARTVNATKVFGSDVWFTGLDGPPSSGATAVTKSVGMGYEFVHGGFILFALATYSNGHSPAGNVGDLKTLTALDKSFTNLALQSILLQEKTSGAGLTPPTGG